MTLDLHFGGGRLRAVPSVHYQFAFAEIVNQAFLSNSSLPKAVAVELGQGAVDAIASWLRQLGIGQSGESKRHLPCMLGLIRRNRRIHPDYKSVALRLQETYGVPLHQLSPRILRQQLGFSALSLYCISPTDSIIEA